jgi:general secretion pathway protein G
MMNKRGKITAIGTICFVIGALALGVGVCPKILPASDDAKRKIARGEMASIRIALDLYRLYFDVYPTSAQGLNILTNHFTTKECREPFLERAPIDPWGTPYRYSLTGNGPQVVCAGPDKEIGTEDDLMPQ